MKLSKNLSLSEVIKSNTAERRGIDNSPNETHLKNLKYLAEQVFQPIRDHFGVPIYISSGYRSPALNEAIGGSPRSFHSEFGTEDNPNWVHVAIAKGRENEKKIKIAEKINGKTQYKIWDRD